MPPELYILYVLGLKYGIYPKEIFRRYSSRKFGKYYGPFGSINATVPFYSVNDRIDQILSSAILNRQVHIFSEWEIWSDKWALFEFIARYATKEIDIPWWFVIKRKTIKATKWLIGI